MDAWEEQIRSPHPMTGSPSAMLSKLKSFAQLRPGRQLAKRFPNGDSEPLPVLGTNGGAVAESLGRRDGDLDQGRQST